MTVIDTFHQRNATHAATRFVPLPLRATLNTTIVTCVDPRVDPAHILGLALGEAAVIRNVGGRITPDTLQTLALLGRLPRPERAGVAAPHLVLLQHTDCGILQLERFPAPLAASFGIPADQLATKAIADPRAAVRVDVALLAATPELPGTLVVAGLVYDVATGLVATVVPPAALQDLRAARPARRAD
jgi:carbonic anhydrase